MTLTKPADAIDGSKLLEAVNQFVAWADSDNRLTQRIDELASQGVVLKVLAVQTTLIPEPVVRIVGEADGLVYLLFQAPGIVVPAVLDS